MMDGKQEVPSGVRLVVADVDGTLVTPDKVLTPRTRAVVRTIIEAGIAFTITSGRPPQGLKALIHDLDLRDPVTAFNGGLVVRPDLSIIREHLVTSKAAQSVIDVLTKHKLDVWVYGDKRLVCHVTPRRSRGTRRVDGQVFADRRADIRRAPGSSRQDRRCE